MGSRTTAAKKVGEPFEQHKVSLTIVNNLFMIIFMIRTFADAQTERFFTAGKSKHFPPDVLKRAGKRLTQLDAAVTLDDLRMPPSNRLEALSGDRAGQWSIRINDQWRVCFRFENGEACDVEITDYH
jgi:toxin HigB-1